MARYTVYFEEVVTYAVKIELPDETPENCLDAEIETKALAVFAAGNYRHMHDSGPTLSFYTDED
jgi:hypothetical protein